MVPVGPYSTVAQPEYRKNLSFIGNSADWLWRMLGDMSLPPGDSELVQIVDKALADAARRAGKWLVCREGCTQCCYGAFAINELDALRLQEGMKTLRGTEPVLAAEIERRARVWIVEHGPKFPGDLKSGALGRSIDEQTRFEEFADEAACPALDPATGRCDVYQWRPMTCRVFGPPVRMGDGAALGHCELCFAGASKDEVAECEMPVPNELEAGLVDEIGVGRETVVAFAVLRSGKGKSVGHQLGKSAGQRASKSAVG
ncbi:MAG: YkgJ family cysteine cluster protein [Terracidiphilus sp.]